MYQSIILAAAAMAMLNSVQAQGIVADCSQFILEGNTLRAVCTNEAGDPIASTINLNQCVANLDGLLVGQPKYVNCFSFRITKCLSPCLRSIHCQD